MKPPLPFYIPEFEYKVDEDSEKSIIEIIREFKWKHVTVVSDNIGVIKSFNQKAAEKNICVTKNAYIHSERYS